MQRFKKRYFLEKEEARDLQNILNLEEQAIFNNLVKPNEMIFQKIFKFKNGYSIHVEINVSDVGDEEDKAFLSSYLYDSQYEEVDKCEGVYSNILSEYKLYDENDNEYIAKIEAL